MLEYAKSLTLGKLAPFLSFEFSNIQRSYVPTAQTPCGAILKMLYNIEMSFSHSETNLKSATPSVLWTDANMRYLLLTLPIPPPEVFTTSSQAQVNYSLNSIKPPWYHGPLLALAFLATSDIVDSASIMGIVLQVVHGM